MSDLKSLKARRENAVRKFALKNSQIERFSSAWFPLNPEKRDGNLRKTERYLVKKSNFERLRLGPLNKMRGILNESGMTFIL